MLEIQELYVNLTRNLRTGETDWYEPYTNDRGELYRHLVREYGRCTSKIYREGPNGPVTCGWVFLKRQKYDDCAETFLAETWVEVRNEAQKRWQLAVTELKIKVHARGNVHVWVKVKGRRVMHRVFPDWPAAVHEVDFDAVDIVTVRELA